MRLTIVQSKYVHIIPNKTSKTAWFCLDSFGRIGAFQRVTTSPNKFFFVYTDTRQRCAVCMASACSKADLIAVGSRSSEKTHCTGGFGFQQENDENFGTTQRVSVF
jgi:hypothetical protein